MRTTNSSQRRAGGLRRAFDRAIATRGIFGASRGSSAPSLSGRSALALFTSLFALVLVASSAFAGETHPFQSSFGSFESLQGLAVDQADGDLYALDIRSGGSVSRFDSAGNPADFSASAPYIAANKLTGTSEGGFAIGQGESEAQLAVAPPGALGGTAGDLYVTESNAGAVAVFAASGQFLGKIDGSGNANPASGGELCGVATDPAGDLYLGYYSGHIDKYVPSADPPLNSDFDSELTGVGSICNLAASSSRVFGISWQNGPATSYPLALFPGGGGEADASAAGTVIEDGGVPVSTAAVDISNDDLYLDELDQVAQFDSAGKLIGHSTSAELTNSRGVAIDASGTASDGNLYAAGGGTKVEVFGPPVIVPDATTEAASAVHRTGATLHGTVNAAGGPDAGCEFQYVTEAHFNAEGFQGAATAPCSPAGPFTGSADQPVSAALAGLSLETAYRFRLLAANANGSAPGAVLGFTTTGSVNVTTGAASNLTGSSATLNGTVNPEGIELEQCRFEYGTAESYGQSVPCAETPAEIGSGEAEVTVHADLASLNGGTTYHFRLAGKNSFGETAGQDSSFTTKGPGLQGEAVSQITETSAELEATVNPNGEPTGYLFEYVTQAQFEAHGYAEATKLPAGGEAIGAGTEDVAVSQPAAGLQPGTTYHFRAVATNPSGTDTGADQTFATYPSPLAESCPANEEFRTGPSAKLPDCRAYEQATPVDKNGTDIQGGGATSGHSVFRASPSGDGVTFFVNGGISGGAGSQDFPIYLARRGASSWSTQGLYPPQTLGPVASVLAVTPDLSRSFSAVGNLGNFQLVSRSSTDGAIKSIGSVPKRSETFALAGVNSDDSRVFFESSFQLTPDAPAGVTNLYLWEASTGNLSLVGILPDSACGSPPCVASAGSFAGPFDWFNGTNTAAGGVLRGYFVGAEHAIAASGDRAYFTAGETGAIYLRQGLLGPTPQTVQVSASQRATLDPNGAEPAVFHAATPDGSMAFFSSCEKLTDDSTAVSDGTGTCDQSTAGQDLYAYRAATGSLTDLTVDNNADDPHGADVRGVLGISDSGSDIYFVANGDLDGPGGATAGNCTTVPPGGTCNLYHWHDGVSTFIARLSGTADGGDATDWAPTLEAHLGTGASTIAMTSRVSADGQTVLFRSDRQLTAYNNQVDCGGAQPVCAELYRYNTSEGLTCISCNPTGAPPVGLPSFSSYEPQLGPRQLTPYLPRNLSSDGKKVFFESKDKLVSTDINGESGCPPPVGYPSGALCQDVYEWEADGAGTCHSSAQNGGCLYLLSGGKDTRSWFVDASTSGNDVFILTRDSLVPTDGDSLEDIYDLRVDGGLASQHPAVHPACVDDECQGTPSQPPTELRPGSSTFGSAPAKQSGHRRKHHANPKRKCGRDSKRKKSRRCHGTRQAHHDHGGAK